MNYSNEIKDKVGIKVGEESTVGDSDSNTGEDKGLSGLALSGNDIWSMANGRIGDGGGKDREGRRSQR